MRHPKSRRAQPKIPLRDWKEDAPTVFGSKNSVDLSSCSFSISASCLVLSPFCSWLFEWSSKYQSAFSKFQSRQQHLDCCRNKYNIVNLRGHPSPMEACGYAKLIQTHWMIFYTLFGNSWHQMLARAVVTLSC
jgi:hypothetical protein